MLPSPINRYLSYRPKPKLVPKPLVSTLMTYLPTPVYLYLLP